MENKPNTYVSWWTKLKNLSGKTNTKVTHLQSHLCFYIIQIEEFIIIATFPNPLWSTGNKQTINMGSGNTLFYYSLLKSSDLQLASPLILVIKIEKHQIRRDNNKYASLLSLHFYSSFSARLYSSYKRWWKL